MAALIKRLPLGNRLEDWNEISHNSLQNMLEDSQRWFYHKIKTLFEQLKHIQTTLLEQAAFHTFQLYLLKILHVHFGKC